MTGGVFTGRQGHDMHPIMDALSIGTSLLAILTIVWSAGRLSQKLDNTVQALTELKGTVVDVVRQVQHNKIDIAVLKDRVDLSVGD